MGNLKSSLTKPDLRLVILGLDLAGKTTVLYRLKKDHFVQSKPTVGFNYERVRGRQGQLRGLTMDVWDVGGQDKFRSLWQQYLRSADGILFVVDLSDAERLEEARLELYRTASNPQNAGIPVVILLNKMDLRNIVEPDEAGHILELVELGRLGTHWSVASTCAVTGEGIDVAMESLYQLILDRREAQRRQQATLRSNKRRFNNSSASLTAGMKRP